MNLPYLTTDCLIIISNFLDKFDNFNLCRTSKNNYEQLLPFFFSKIKICHNYFSEFENRIIVKEIPETWKPFIKKLVWCELIDISKFKTLHTFKIWDCALYERPILCNNLSLNLHTLKIYSSFFNKPLDNLPLNLHTLKIRSDLFNQPLDKLPLNLHTLRIRSDSVWGNDKFNQLLLRNDLASNLHTLIIWNMNNFNQPFYRAKLPSSLCILQILECKKFNQPLDKLPSNLYELAIWNCNSFNQPLLRSNLPLNLHTLKIESYVFNQSLDYLPSKLHTLVIRSSSFRKYKIPKTLTKCIINYKAYLF